MKKIILTSVTEGIGRVFVQAQKSGRYGCKQIGYVDLLSRNDENEYLITEFVILKSKNFKAGIGMDMIDMAKQTVKQHTDQANYCFYVLPSCEVRIGAKQLSFLETVDVFEQLGFKKTDNKLDGSVQFWYKLDF